MLSYVNLILVLTLVLIRSITVTRVNERVDQLASGAGRRMVGRS